jgi:hypothetical protein
MSSQTEESFATRFKRACEEAKQLPTEEERQAAAIQLSNQLCIHYEFTTGAALRALRWIDPKLAKQLASYLRLEHELMMLEWEDANARTTQR